MKLKKKLRAFFTLARKGDGGFTLVELVVVIAILAILGGIGTVGYSAYVTKANESADRQMIADVEQALILGAYSKLLDTNETLTVGLSRKADATASTSDYDGNSVYDVEEIMVAAFGENWKQALLLKSDLCENNYGKVYQLISENPEMFSSVPVSSFYGTEGNTAALVADVDEMVGALYGVLGGNSYAFSNFWGDDFHATVKEGGLGETWNSADNAQMAANLTAFAAANQITNVMTGAQNGDTSASATLNNWTASWTGDTKDVTIGDAYVADLVMQYAQCNAVYNYTIANLDPETSNEYWTVVDAYTALENKMNNMQNKSDNESYLTVFNNAVSSFWSDASGVRAVWQNSGQAEKDAEALLATMAALNTLESDYVNAGQTELLNSSNAFAQAGAADVLDGMVAAANTDISGKWEWMVVVKVVDGTPTVQFGLPEE